VTVASGARASVKRNELPLMTKMIYEYPCVAANLVLDMRRGVKIARKGSYAAVAAGTVLTFVAKSPT
jgi:hypothetical protein